MSDKTLPLVPIADSIIVKVNAMIERGFMKKLVFILVAVGCFLASGAGNARADDGGPTLARPSWCTGANTYTLSGDDSYHAPPSGYQCVIGGTGPNVIDLQDDHDWSDGRGGGDSLVGGLGQDILYGGMNADYINGGDGDDSLFAGCPGGCDQTGQTDGNTLEAGAGDDIIGAANNIHDLITCGSGYDTVYFDPRADTLSNPSACEDKHAQ
jgi:Ca2+-binding RTX toxin-like protein